MGSSEAYFTHEAGEPELWRRCSQAADVEYMTGNAPHRPRVEVLALRLRHRLHMLRSLVLSALARRAGPDLKPRKWHFLDRLAAEGWFHMRWWPRIMLGSIQAASVRWKRGELGGRTAQVAA